MADTERYELLKQMAFQGTCDCPEFTVNRFAKSGSIVRICVKCGESITTHSADAVSNVAIKRVVDSNESIPSAVMSNLFLGGFKSAMNKQLLVDKNVKLIINTAKDIHLHFPAFKSAVSEYEGLGIKYICCEWVDSVAQNLRVDEVMSLVQAMESVISSSASSTASESRETVEVGEGKEGGVLVHCMQGVSRSAALVCAYLMWKIGTSSSFSGGPSIQQQQKQQQQQKVQSGKVAERTDLRACIAGSSSSSSSSSSLFERAMRIVQGARSIAEPNPAFAEFLQTQWQSYCEDTINNNNDKQQAKQQFVVTDPVVDSTSSITDACSSSSSSSSSICSIVTNRYHQVFVFNMRFAKRIRRVEMQGRHMQYQLAVLSTLGGAYHLCNHPRTALQLAYQQEYIGRVLGSTSVVIRSRVFQAVNYRLMGYAKRSKRIFKECKLLARGAGAGSQGSAGSTCSTSTVVSSSASSTGAGLNTSVSPANTTLITTAVASDMLGFIEASELWLKGQQEGEQQVPVVAASMKVEEQAKRDEEKEDLLNDTHSSNVTYCGTLINTSIDDGSSDETQLLSQIRDIRLDGGT